MLYGTSTLYGTIPCHTIPYHTIEHDLKDQIDMCSPTDDDYGSCGSVRLNGINHTVRRPFRFDFIRDSFDLFKAGNHISRRMMMHTCTCINGWHTHGDVPVAHFHDRFSQL